MASVGLFRLPPTGLSARTAPCGTSDAPLPLIIDSDPGLDDALAWAAKKAGAATWHPVYLGAASDPWNTLLEELIKLGVNVNAVSKAGVTPWLAASGQGDRLGGVLYNKAGADILEKYGADPKLGHPCQAQNKCRAE